MRVKRLEIQGFKSFKDKTVIHFDHSITGIVGPNGSGKSNIVDAFFWVMGEQSYKHMRGNSSEDLIFNGSSKYSPMGMAEATLVLESDIVDTANAPAGATVADQPLPLKTKEIAVTRRLYRSGEGEYFINGHSARLKDIHELFMDTGVGAKGYSVIEQGQIGKIVNAKPEDRRLLIEEAAGIAKYKARKKESLRKMEATQANLARLTDIIQEIEKSLASLERQAQKARQYKKYKDELLDKEMTWGRRKRYVYLQKLDSLRSQKEKLEQDLIGLRAQLQTSENTIEVSRVGLLTETKKAEDLQTQIQDLASDLSHEKSALELSRRRQGDLESQLEALEGEKIDLQESIETDTQRLEESTQQVQVAEQSFQTTAQEAQKLNEIVNALRKETDQARAQLDQSQKELKGGMAQISDLNSKAAALLSKAESTRFQAAKLLQQAETQNEKLLTIREELEESKAILESVRKQSDLLQLEKKEQSALLQIEEQELKRSEKEKNEALRAFTQLKSRLESLEELDQSNEGMADGPKAALDWARLKGKGQEISALTDNLEITSGYESVLESWLESKIESLVTKDPEFVLPMLEKIRNDKQGRVGIQLLSEKASIAKRAGTSRTELQSILEKNGFKVIGELSEFIRSHGKSPHGKAVERLVAEVIVVESSEPMPRFFLSKDFESLAGWSIAGMDGVILEGQGVIRGGSSGSAGALGILRRKKSIEELQGQVVQAEDQLRNWENVLASAKEKMEISRARLQVLQSDLQSLEIQSAGKERDVHQMERAFQEAQAHLNSFEKDSREMSLAADRAIEDKERVEAELQEITATRIDLEDTISSHEKGLNEKEQALRAQDAELQQIRVKEASFRERSSSLKRELDGIQSLLKDRRRRLTEIDRTLERAKSEQAQFTGGESELEQRVEDLTLELARAREELSMIKDQIEQSNAKVNGSLEKVKELHKAGDLKTSEANQLALEIEKLSGELSYLVLNLEEKYGQGCLERPMEIPQTQEAQAEEESTEAQAFDENGEPVPTVIKVSAGNLQAPSLLNPVELTPEEELALGEQVERLRERIRRLGEVNVMAIEEFEQLKKRYDHLLSERTDLERSLKNLEAAIEHINKTSEERFEKAFTAIAERFERLFPIIFGGGQAKLSLIYPEGSADILEAGVDILAQPPGKKVANITLLSGGEKALTAVSLIFAIFMVKPSPFCVLDEVDAPLDDANIGKFNALLREMSSKSQFILITHNKKTMELNDTLYGVTMEEPGVSKMVSIELQ